MNKRLIAIYNEIPAGTGIIDVGTDHGYIPAALAKSGYKGRIIASDINAGPLDSARRTAASENVSDRIEFSLANGLEKCPDSGIDTILIAGMGGDLITKILDSADWETVKKCTLILQPATKSEILRYFLIHNEFDIFDERLVKNAGIVYPIIKAKLGTAEPYSDAELYAGAFRYLKDKPLYIEKLDDQIKRLRIGIAGLESAEHTNESRIAFMRSVLRESVELREKL